MPWTKSNTMARNPERTRRRIEEVALALFAEKGTAATTHEIAALAGIAEGALYRHFRGRDDLVAELFRARGADLAAHLEVVADTPGDARDSAAAIVEDLCYLFDADRALF